ncbi:hypothetical protein Tco_0271807 [Tanacetum coccineum]
MADTRRHGYAVSSLMDKRIGLQNNMAPLPPRDQRHLWLRYQVEGYTEEIVHDFEQRLEMIFRRQVNRVHILDFEGLNLDMRQDLAERLRMVYTRDDGQEIFLGGARRSMTWRQFILGLGFHTAEEIVEGGFEAYWLGSKRVIPDKGDLSGGRHLKRHAEGKKSGARLSGGHFIRRLAHHFGLVSDDGLRGLSVVTRELHFIDMGGAENAPNVDEGTQAVPTPIHAPLPPPPPAERSMIDQGRSSTWMVSCMTQLIEASGRTYQAFDGTFRGSYLEVFERRTRCMTDGACTSTAQQDEQQPDP